MKRLIIAAALVGTAVTGTAIAQTAAPSAPRHAGADTNSDGAITRAEAIAAADARFVGLDKNRDGKLTADERPGRRGPDGAKADKPDVTREQFREHAAKRFDRADANKDGRIDGAERQNMRGKHGGDRFAKHGRHHGGGGMNMLTRADLNRDGVLTKAEVTTAAAAMFDRVDANHDGRIDQAERGAVRGQMKRHDGGQRSNGPATPAL